MPVPDAWRNTLLALLIVSALPLGVLALLAWDERRVRRRLPGLVCFAAGALLGAAFFQLLPEAYASADAPRLVPAVALAGYASFLGLEWLLHGRGDDHAHGAGHGRAHPPHPAAHAPGLAGPTLATAGAGGGVPPRALVALNLLGDGLHNLLDGVLIAATFLADPAVGVLTTVAVSLHEIPREIGSFGVLLHGGVSARQAVVYNVGTAGIAVTGAVLTLLVGPHLSGIATALLPFAAGNFLYIAASLLVPLLRGATTGRERVRRAATLALGLLATGAPAFWR